MRLTWLLLLLFNLLLPLHPAHAERLDFAHKRDTLVVGVKADYPPFGTRNAAGELVGFEADLAAELARRIGVKLQLKVVTSADRMQKLEEGTVHMVIATLGDTAQRRSIANLIEPHYYASGVTVLTPPDSRIATWDDLKGRKVCVTQGAYYNRDMAQRYALELHISNSLAEASAALREGRCVALLYDDIALSGMLAKPEWSNYKIPLPSTLVVPWAIAIPVGGNDWGLGRAIGDALADLHRSGWLVAAEQRWGLAPSRFLADAQHLWSQTTENGGWLCQRLANGEWPTPCRDAQRVAESKEDAKTQQSGMSAYAEVLETVQKRDALVVGVKADYPPFGMRDSDGQLVGFEPDLAAEIARRLGVKLKLSAVTSANRLQKLEEGAIDVVIATLGDTAQRRRIATLIEPHYYASGVTVLTPPDSRVTSWSDLRGRKVCATQGAYYNREMAQRYLLDLQIFNGNRDTRLALRDGRCIAWMYDDIALARLRMSPDWSEYNIPLPSALVSPWAIAISNNAAASGLERAIGNVLADLHRTGWLIAAEQRWELAPSKFLADTQKLWTQHGEDGAPLCKRLATGEWPAACRHPDRQTSSEVSGIKHFGLLLRERTGIDLNFLYDPYDRGQFFRGLLMSIELMLACIIGSLFIGCVGAVVAESRWRLLGILVRSTAAIGRMTPPLLLVYMIFFGIGHLLVTRLGWPVDGLLVATTCLSTYAGCSTVFALLDASAVLRQRHPGFTLSWRNLPAALRLAYAPVVAILVNVVKATGMASTIAVPELISVSTALIAENGNPGVMMNVLMLTYFLLVLLVVHLFTVLERRLLR